MIRKSYAAATESAAAAAATALLARGNAVDAVCAGVLAACAADPGVIMGPMHVLVAGPGFGVRCIDGRLRQPGRSAPRPRGFLSEEEVPPAARVAVPALPAAIATALSMFGTQTHRQVAEPALAALERKHPRRMLLDALSREGPSVLVKDPFAEAFVAAFGRLAGGIMTTDDLRAQRAPADPCNIVDGAAFAPFTEDAPHGELHAVCAGDRRGGVAVACYEIARDGFTVESLGVIAPFRAQPVMRGVRRVEPGAPVASTSSVLLVSTRNDDRFDVAAGFSGDRAAKHTHDLAAAVAKGTTLEAALKSLSPAVAVLETERGAKAYSFTP
jgi:gamma-glutamyltranspeptidase/glutathione hydrolase